MVKKYHEYIKEMAIPYINDNKRDVYKAIYNNDEKKLEELSHKMSFDFDDSYDSYSPLEYAALTGRIKTIDALVKYGANVNYGSPIAFAFYRKNIETIKHLISIGADINNKATRGEVENKRPIEVALITDLLEFALDLGANPDYYKNYKNRNTPFIFLVKKNKDIITLIIHGADLTLGNNGDNIFNRNIYTPNWLTHDVIEAMLEYQPHLMLFIKNSLGYGNFSFVPEDLMKKYKDEFDIFDDSQELGLL